MSPAPLFCGLIPPSPPPEEVFVCAGVCTGVGVVCAGESGVAEVSGGASVTSGEASAVELGEGLAVSDDSVGSLLGVAFDV